MGSVQSTLRLTFSMYPEVYICVDGVHFFSLFASSSHTQHEWIHSSSSGVVRFPFLFTWIEFSVTVIHRIKLSTLVAGCSLRNHNQTRISCNFWFSGIKFVDPWCLTRFKPFLVVWISPKDVWWLLQTLMQESRFRLLSMEVAGYD